MRFGSNAIGSSNLPASAGQRPPPEFGRGPLSFSKRLPWHSRGTPSNDHALRVPRARLGMIATVASASAAATSGTTLA